MVRVGEWVLGAVGAFAVFLGLFIMFAGDEQYLGYVGFSWRVGDITAAWAWGLLVGGIALVVLALVLVVAQRRPHTHR